MKTIKIKILAWLLHHANREGKDKLFYNIKSKILSRYGKFVGWDIQFIEGKECWSCNGSGTFKSWWKMPELCWSCMGTGWYKDPVWNILERIEFGNYTLHQPQERRYTKPAIANIPSTYFEGYINHKRSKFGEYAKFILFLIYDRKVLKYHSIGRGWRVKWWYPENWLNNFIHLIRNRNKAIPFQFFKERIKRKFIRKRQPINQIPDNELPF